MPIDVYLKIPDIDGEVRTSTSWDIVSTEESRETTDAGTTDTLVFDLDGGTGAEGAKAEDAFFVKVDSETTTQTDADPPDPDIAWDTGGLMADAEPQDAFLF